MKALQALRQVLETFPQTDEISRTPNSSEIPHVWLDSVSQTGILWNQFNGLIIDAFCELAPETRKRLGDCACGCGVCEHRGGRGE